MADKKPMRQQQPSWITQWAVTAWDHVQAPMVKRRIRKALSEVYRPEGVAIWMAAPHQQFGGATVDTMVKGGRSGEVLAAVERLSSGAFS